MNKRIISLIFIIIISLAVSILLLHVDYSLAATSASDIQNKIDKYQNQQKKVQQQLENAQNNLSKNQDQMGVTKNLIQQTEADISRKEAELENLNERIDLNKNLLRGYLQEAYINDEDPLYDLLLNGGNLNDVVGNLDQMTNVKEKILSILSDINDTKNEAESAKNDLAAKQDDHEKLLSIQQGQQYEIKSDISQAQATLQELNDKINKLKSQLSSFLGSAVSYKNVVDAAGYAEKVTGVRKDYLLGVLVVESDLGRYTGGCNFKESNMSGARATLFKGICSELKYDYTKMKVSCPPKGYKGTGGAMGVAQFMPDTWVGYKSSISSVTGHNPPDPWSLTDGVVAMALKLAKVDGVTAHKRDAEAKAYCVYLAGGNWKSYCDSKGVDYGAKVLYWADNYQRVLN